jgi:CheY-like chemotaxis protein
LLRVRFIPSGGAGQDIIYFEVEDTGIGIGREVQRNLFEPFYQGESSTTRRFGGTGLGLAICKRLVDLLGGNIGFSSECGSGSRFWFQIPVRVPENIKNTSQEPLRFARPALVMSASAAVRDHFLHLLSSLGVENYASHDTSGIKAGGFAVVLVDADTISPGPSLDAPVLLISGWREDVVVPPAALRLQKPVHAAKLRNALLQCLGCKPASPTAPPDFHPVARVLRILVAEDNPINRLVAERTLERMGCVVEVAGNGLEAVQLAGKSEFDAILMDWHMPVLDGLEATSRIRAAERSRRTPIIALTASALEGDRQVCIDAGMDGYLSKPVQPEQLLEMLASVTGSR